MNATRAATIRLRSSFDGAVSLGRVQTPTLAILARREEEIRAFKPEPYWVVDASFDTVKDGRAATRAASTPAPTRGSRPPRRRPRSSRPCDGQTGEITKLEKSERKERAPLLYDLTSLQRDANSRFGFSARRTLAAAQRLYEEHKALTYPRTNSRYITGDMIAEIKPIAKIVGEQQGVRARPPSTCTGLDVLPLGRVVNDAKVTDHHAIIPTRAEHHPVEKMNDDDRRIYDLVARRFLAIFHPDAVFENTRVETTVAGHVFRTRGKLMLVPGLARRVRRGGRHRRRRWRRRRGPRAAAAQARARRGASHVQEVGVRGQGDQAAAALHRGLAAGARWRPPASSSTRRSCARR